MMTPQEFREARLALGMSKAELARRLGISDRQVRNYENGRSSPTGPVLVILRLLYESQHEHEFRCIECGARQHMAPRDA